MTQNLTVAQIYQHYSIPDNLAEHMLGTAALGKIVYDNWLETSPKHQKPNQQLILSCLLLHDLGNLVKFDLSQPVPSNKPKHLAQFAGENLKYWRQKQQTMIKKYSSNTTQANLKILEELGLDAEKKLLTKHEFDLLPELVAQPRHWEEKIVFYCDARFMPFGLTTVGERLTDLKTRYQATDPDWRNQAIVAERLRNTLALETQLNRHTKIDLTSIQAAEIEPWLNKLMKFKVRVNFKE